MNNDIWIFGNNYRGQLGLGDRKNRNIPTKIRSLSENSIYAKYVSCNSYHTALIDMNNEVWVFGSNLYGQLGLGNHKSKDIPTKITNIYAKTVSCGFLHTVIIDMNNDIWTFGDNRHGQLGLVDKVWSNIPTKITIDSSGESGLAVRSNIIARSVSCGGNHTVIITK